MTREERVAMLKRMGESVPAHLLEPAPADVSEDRPGRKHPLCEHCGEVPHLGRSMDGRVVSLCRSCAEEDYLKKLTPEERSLLRNV